MHNPSFGCAIAATAPGAVPFLGPAAASLTQHSDPGGTVAGIPTEDDDPPVEWSEEDVVLLHWRLLLEVRRLSDPAAPLEEKYDTLRWIFTERAKDARPFSFVNCLRVVGCSPLSPIAYCGRLDAEELRDHVRHNLKAWLGQTLQRYPAWVREAVASNPAWNEANLAKNPQWINEQIKRMSTDGDLFA
jgi:hypothetical protein